jgi:hypothetical protein
MLCSVEPQVVARLFQNAFLKQTAISGLPQKLQHQTLEITVEEIPNQFTYVSRGRAIVLIVAYTVSGLEVITPEAQKLVVRYRLLDEGRETLKKGRLILANEQEPLVNRVRTSRNFTRQYVEAFLKANASLAERLVGKLTDEL